MAADASSDGAVRTVRWVHRGASVPSGASRPRSGGPAHPLTRCRRAPTMMRAGSTPAESTVSEQSSSPNRVAIVQIPPILLDRAATLAVVVEKIDEAADAGAGLIAFPEAFVPGY